MKIPFHELTFEKVVKNTELVIVRQARHLNTSVAVKSMKLKDYDYRDDIDDPDVVGKCLYWSEVYFTKMVSDTKFPHFVEYLDHYVTPLENELTLITKWIPKSITFAEYVEQKKDTIRYKDFMNILFQIIFTIVKMQKLGIVHHDLHAGNIILTPILYDCDAFEYHLDSHKFFIENLKIRAVITDFGFASQPGKVQCRAIPILFDYKNLKISRKHIDFWRVISFLEHEASKVSEPASVIGHFMNRNLKQFGQDTTVFTAYTFFSFLDVLPNAKLIK